VVSSIRRVRAVPEAAMIPRGPADLSMVSATGVLLRYPTEAAGSIGEGFRTTQP
jgi:hypothetical protein